MYKNKKFCLQFLPSIIENLTKNKYFFYKEKRLKSSYIIDIVHNFLLKYYIKKENNFPSSSLILKEKYGHQYNYYINYLKDNNIIFLKRDYLVGSHTKVYSLDPNILKDKIFRYKNYDAILVKKYVNRLKLYENNIIDDDIKKKLIEDLYSVKIQVDKTMFYIDSLKSIDSDSYNKNIYSIESINEKHIFYQFDNYGRFHTNFTILKSFVRKNCLLIDGEETCEFDIKNSQPLFLSKIIKDSKPNFINNPELELFSNLVINGKYYQYLIDFAPLKNKEEAKDLTYKVLFGRNMKNSKNDKIFFKLFPTIHNFITSYKKEFNDYRIMSHNLQKAESNLIFNKIIRSIIDSYPNMKIITVHDSIIVQKKYQDLIGGIFNYELDKYFKKSESELKLN